MEFRWMQAFVAVAEELHFGRAATRLHMAQSPLSQTIRKLEKDLGVALFERSTRQVTLTAAGQALLPHARSILAETENARSATRASSGEVYGRVAIGFSGVVNHFSLPLLARSVRERYPNVSLELVGGVGTRDAVEKLDSGRLDLAFVAMPVDAAVVRSRLIAVEPFGAVLPTNHPFVDRTQIDIVELADQDFVMAHVRSSIYESTMQACVDAGFRPRIVQEVTDPYMILMLVAAGVGIALMAEGMAGFLPPGAAFVPLVGTSLRMPHGIAWSPKYPSLARDAVLRLADQVLPSPPTDVGD